MLIKRSAPHHPTERDVTPESVYQDRRLILKGLGLGAAATLTFPTKASLLISSPPRNRCRAPLPRRSTTGLPPGLRG